MENILAISSIILQYRAIVTNARFLHEHKTHIILNYIHDNNYDDLKNKICNLRVDKMLVKNFIS